MRAIMYGSHLIKFLLLSACTEVTKTSYRPESKGGPNGQEDWSHSNRKNDLQLKKAVEILRSRLAIGLAPR